MYTTGVLMSSQGDWKDLKLVVTTIVNKAVELKNRRTTEASAQVSYCAIFCQSKEEYQSFLRSVSARGRLADDTPTGPVFVVAGIQTDGGECRVVKIRKPDPTRPERGDADFAAQDYEGLKLTSVDAEGFKLISRPDFEMIELMDPAYDVRVYFSNPPVEQHRGIREALAG
ncbi:MAG TPA: hypothetical protein VHO01_07910 [Jatrophihabitans sp.]|nr:hypothetical protein [Jatrophihabitans sp.]